ncbi:MAG: hypothetical protein Q4D17_10965, partial [Planctomycetia bacterium]|nr:hypothetical protein [Planctomycetia bacterium]
MDLNLFFEAGMMICFGASWPIALWKLWTSKSCGGVSLRFYSMIILGYLLGLARFTETWNWVGWFYLVNIGMVSAAALLVIKYLIRD